MAWDPWENADEGDDESATGSVREDLKILTRYVRLASALVEPFRKLGDALETKKISVYADRIERRVDEATKMYELLRGAPPLIKAFFDEIEGLCLALADGSADPSLGSQTVLNELTSYQQLLTLGEQLLEYESQIREQDEESDDHYIDWKLEEYLGGEAKIYQRLERLNIPSLVTGDGDYLGSRTIYGVLLYYNAEYVESRVDEIRDSEES